MNSMRLPQGVLLAALALWIAPSVAGDPQAGQEKAKTCLGCHGIAGYMNVYPSYHVPKVGGQQAEYVIAALQAYRDEDRRHPTMVAQSWSLSDEDIADIAAYFAASER
jgi:cytochrome c553